MIEKAMFGDIYLPADKKSRRSAAALRLLLFSGTTGIFYFAVRVFFRIQMKNLKFGFA